VKKKLLIALLGLMLSAGSANALLIDFEDLPGTRLPLPFEDRPDVGGVGFEQNYLGFDWLRGGASGPSSVLSNSGKGGNSGWGGATNEAVGSDPGFSDNPQLSVGDDWFAYNAGGDRSLWIDFKGESHDFNSGRFASLLDVNESVRSDSIEIFGYSGADLGTATLIGSAGSLTFATDGTFETLAGNLAGINFLEIRSDRDLSWFTVDDLCFDGMCSSNSSGTNTSGGSNNTPPSKNTPSGQNIPEPSTVALLGSGLVGMLLWKRNKSKV